MAERPGSEPMTSPYTEAASIVMMTSDVEIRRKASSEGLQHARSPRHRNEARRERHAQQFVEDQVDADRRQDRQRNARA